MTTDFNAPLRTQTIITDKVYCVALLNRHGEIISSRDGNKAKLKKAENFTAGRSVLFFDEISYTEIRYANFAES